jgi:hypothetical protein
LHIYTRKQRWKFLLLAGALIIGIATSWYTNTLVRKLESEEKLKMETWAEATKQMSRVDPEKNGEYFEFLLRITLNNNTIPVIT